MPQEEQCEVYVFLGKSGNDSGWLLERFLADYERKKVLRYQSTTQNEER